VWAVLVRQRALVEEANKQLSQQSTETAELRVADVARAREEATKTHEDLAPLLARVKELEEDIASVGGQRDALNIALEGDNP
jgi:uncharacterized protein YlxW (UPF0749 family)